MSDITTLTQRLRDAEKLIDTLQADLRQVRTAYADAVMNETRLKDQLAAAQKPTMESDPAEGGA